MLKVNYWYIWAALFVLEEAEAVQGRPLDIDANDEQSMKHAFKSHVLPWVQDLLPQNQELLKVSFAYFLQQDRFPGDEIFANIPDLTMNAPDDLRQFFEWFWESLYPGTDYRDIPANDVIEDNDIMRTNEFS